MESLLLAEHKNLTRDNGPLPKLEEDPTLLTRLPHPIPPQDSVVLFCFVLNRVSLEAQTGLQFTV